MHGSGVTMADIEAHLGGKKRGPKSGKKTAAVAAVVPAKYMDLKTGATWSGRGRAPAWIANAKNRTHLLIDGKAATASCSAAAKSVMTHETGYPHRNESHVSPLMRDSSRVRSTPFVSLFHERAHLRQRTAGGPA